MSLFLLLSILAVVVLLTSMGRIKSAVLPIALTGLVLALGLLFSGFQLEHRLLKDMAEFDRFAVLFSILITVVTGLVLLLLNNPAERSDIPRVEMTALLLFSLVGAIMLTSFTNLVMLFLGVEILSIPIYVLAGSRKREAASNEAALKYFINGAFATGILLFGIGLIYAGTGQFTLQGIASWAELNPADFHPLFHLGMLLMLCGLAFKISAAPFHFWTPDVYEGAPSVITAFMSTVVKVAAVAAFYRLFARAFPAAVDQWAWVLAALAALTLAVGNLGALVQRGFKRLMAYSGISHAGFLMLALLSSGPGSAGALWLYSAAYAFATLIAFVAWTALEESGSGETVDSFMGLGSRSPLLAVGVTVAMLSLIGVPPLGGFFGKLFVFGNAVGQHFTALVVFAVVMSAVGMAYYMRPVIQSWFRAPAGQALVLRRSQSTVLVFCMVLLFALAVAPALIFRFI